MELLQNNQCFAGEQRIYRFASSTLKKDSKFGIFLPQQALTGQACPALFYLAGLTCNEETFAIKAHAQRLAAQLGLILITPDTSPRGDDVAKGDHWDLGQGAGFYINATQAPWAEHYQMQSFIVDELYSLVENEFNIAKGKVGIFGHSMGGHGALTLALKYPEKFKSVSAFAPICAPSQCPWGEKAFSNYLGEDRSIWLQHDATALLQEKGALFSDILIDQGLKDQFYSQLNPALFQEVCQQVGQKLTLREHQGYDHGYYFIQSFIDDHLQYHAVQLQP
ncbi:S-formylglutathione hydrolase [Acinetobacter sp. B51(2017)]|uniref:S-formylglutathione hydrolase n=1 Tax=Acinetobacter sp. B51(2017) TaxID=2060938 RepID=UPI000F0891CA|nr:S-formylglutathione hydrolase [Acinetobacter sp. B51(2017)]